MASVFPRIYEPSTQSLQRELEQRELEIKLLREITALVGSEFDLQKVFDRVARRARELLCAETVLIPVLNPGQDSYTYRAANGADADELLNETLPVEIGVCGWVLKNRKPWWQGALDELSEHERNRWEKTAGTVILVPLVGKHNFLGGIAGLNKIGAAEFNERDLELLTMFANQVSIAIENAMMVGALSKANKNADALRKKLEKTNRKLIRTNVELQHLAVHDPLTNLPNRTLIMDRLNQGIRAASRDKDSLALIMIDLDHFKEVNDTLGHAVGDELLLCIGKRFQDTLRNVDTLGRLGGDEFAVVVTETDLAASIIVAKKLQKSLHKPIVINGNNFSIGASMGMALYPDHGLTPSVLLKSADVAMYVAKRNNDEFCVYDEQLDEHHPNQLTLLGDLRAAIQGHTIGIVLQPKLNLDTKQIVGAEALARWSHPERGPLSPSEFVPVLEKTGLIKPFTLQILEKSIQACSECRAAGFDISVAVNLSTYNLRDPHLPEQVAALLARYEMDQNTLVLEITESAIMSDPEQTMDVLLQLDAMNVRLSIDDFGTGYSSLSYLKKLPVHQLKIDRSFVSGVTTDSDDAIIVRSTVDLAHNLGLAVVAEGVEEEDVMKMIQSLGCELVQGYLISRPLEPDEFLAFLNTTEWSVKRLPPKTE